MLLVIPGAPERFCTWIGSGLTHKHNTKLARPSRYKHTSLLRTSINYGQKSVIILAPGLIHLKLAKLSMLKIKSS
jgi:hypothetical protein